MNRKIYSIIFIIAFACSSLNFCDAQNPQLFGMTYGGGAHSSGTIFKMNDDGSGFQTVYSFNTATGINPYGTLLQANDGKLYGMTLAGGANLYGALFRFDPFDSSYSDVFDFNLSTGASPYGSLIQATNGKLYGMTPTAAALTVTGVLLPVFGSKFEQQLQQSCLILQIPPAFFLKVI